MIIAEQEVLQRLSLAARDVYDDDEAFESHSIAVSVKYDDVLRCCVVAFRGTDEVDDWFYNLDAHRESHVRFNRSELHHGFFRAWDAVRSQVTNAVMRLSADAGSPGPLCITGHSLGGAIAMICAAALFRDGFLVRTVATFGAPRVGDKLWAKYYDNEGLNEHTVRIVNSQDIVPLVPFAHWGYRHVDSRVLLIEENTLSWRQLPLWRQWAGTMKAMVLGFGVGALAHHDMDNYARDIISLPMRGES